MKEILFKYLRKYTSFSEEEQQVIASEIQVDEYKKGSILLRQGDIPTKCYFILKGCIRQYAVDASGREVTSNFYTEEQAVVIYNEHSESKSSNYMLTCLEDCVLVVGNLATINDTYNKYPQLESMTNRMTVEIFGSVQEDFANFIASSPEERFKSLLHKRPGLIDRVPQHQLASYLGVTPESLSRIKKRISHL
ncbi:Crp/Fnr family transcriptional regulator [Paenibacillus sp. OAS669]|uniref:Crp/Fnr family transcriptional regulator n=1 Tax=Paenibacillus sp. OAS669 TaxID=2663821 RepID=UPI00178A4EDD|nr:Crp/Fnr family transcriptional regulator [Paenibacillus sp. OAS669]